MTRYLDLEDILATKVVLVLNGQRLLASAEAGEQLMLELVAGRHDLGEIADWLSTHNSSTTPS